MDKRFIEKQLWFISGWFLGYMLGVSGLFWWGVVALTVGSLIGGWWRWRT